MDGSYSQPANRNVANRKPAFLFYRGNDIARSMAKKPAPKRKPGRPRTVFETKAPAMPARTYDAWQAALGLTDSQAARILGTAPSTIARYRTAGGPALLGLACAAVAAGLPSWNKGK